MFLFRTICDCPQGLLFALCSRLTPGRTQGILLDARIKPRPDDCKPNRLLLYYPSGLQRFWKLNVSLNTLLICFIYLSFIYFILYRYGNTYTPPCILFHYPLSKYSRMLANISCLIYSFLFISRSIFIFIFDSVLKIEKWQFHFFFCQKENPQISDFCGLFPTILDHDRYMRNLTIVVFNSPSQRQ